MNNLLSSLRKTLLLTLVIAASGIASQAQVCCYWNFEFSKLLHNIPVINGSPVQEIDLLTSSNTRLRLNKDGQWQINPWSGAGGFISTPAGQADNATFKILAGGTSGIVSYSFQNADWGQNYQSYVGRAKTVSYVVNWNGSDRFYVAGQGWLFANGAWFNSDRKLKANIKPLENALEKVLQLTGYTYSFKEENRAPGCDSATSPVTDNKIQMGLMADEVEAIVPEVVRTLDGNKKALAYQNLVALLIESTKDQQKIIGHLQAQVTVCFALFVLLLIAMVSTILYARKAIARSGPSKRIPLG